MFTRILIALALAAGLSVGIATAPAEAAGPACYVAPTHSVKADHCRARGWILTSTLRVDPHRVFSFTRWNLCSADRSTECVVADGISDGPIAYVGSNGKRHAVWPSDPRLSGHRGGATVTGRWLTAGERADLAAEYGHAPRWWKGCVADLATGTVSCADGTQVS
jgi:hypothetical protein